MFKKKGSRDNKDLACIDNRKKVCTVTPQDQKKLTPFEAVKY
jgi:hypothetical protein